MRFDKQILSRNIHMFLFFYLYLHEQMRYKMDKKEQQNDS